MNAQAPELDRRETRRQRYRRALEGIDPTLDRIPDSVRHDFMSGETANFTRDVLNAHTQAGSRDTAGSRAGSRDTDNFA